LNQRRPIFRATAAFGHFGWTGPGITWELTYKSAGLREDARIAAAAR